MDRTRERTTMLRSEATGFTPARVEDEHPRELRLAGAHTCSEFPSGAAETRSVPNVSELTRFASGLGLFQQCSDVN